MRRITDHVVSLDQSVQLDVTALDELGPGGANHHYLVSADSATNWPVYFQKGPVAENGVNGLTNEVLLALVLDRLRGFQAGPYKCRENAIALTHCEEALMWLQKRTRDRIGRGVEGTSTV